MKKGREIIGAILAIAIVLTIGVFLIGPDPTISGLVIFADGCGSTLNTSGTWELNASLSCPTGDAITVSVSNVIFNCQSNPITGNYDAGSNAFIFGDSLTNISIQNCNLTGFTDPITVGSGSNLTITATHVEENATCVTGAWTDGGSNSGCLTEVEEDTTAPVLNLVNQTTYTNISFSYQINATDDTNVSNYSINEGSTASFTNGTINFTVSATGLISNATALPVNNYTMLVNVSDPSGNSEAQYFNVHVLTGTSAPPEEEEEEEEEEESEESESSGSAASQGTACVLSDWACTSWGACEDDGFQRRVCSKVDEDNECTGGLPETKRECVEEEETTNDPAAAEATATSEPLEQEGVAITGGAITPFDRITDSVKVLGSGKVIFGAIAVLVIGFVLTLVLGRRMRERANGGGSTATPKLSFGAFIKKLTSRTSSPSSQKSQPPSVAQMTDDDKKKLWDWEERNK